MPSLHRECYRTLIYIYIYYIPYVLTVHFSIFVNQPIFHTLYFKVYWYGHVPFFKFGCCCFFLGLEQASENTGCAMEQIYS